MVFYIQDYYQEGTLIQEQQQGQKNILFKIIKAPAKLTAHA
jgi:hypothetical protein